MTTNYIANLNNGKKCTRKSVSNSKYCWQHHTKMTSYLNKQSGGKVYRSKKEYNDESENLDDLPDVIYIQKGGNIPSAEYINLTKDYDTITKHISNVLDYSKKEQKKVRQGTIDSNAFTEDLCLKMDDLLYEINNFITKSTLFLKKYPNKDKYYDNINKMIITAKQTKQVYSKYLKDPECNKYLFEMVAIPSDPLSEQIQSTTDEAISMSNRFNAMFKRK